MALRGALFIFSLTYISSHQAFLTLKSVFHRGWIAVCVCVCEREREERKYKILLSSLKKLQHLGDVMILKAQEMLKNQDRKQSCKSNSQNM